MSAIAESLRRQRLPLLTLVAVLVLGAVAWGLISQTTAEHLTTPDHPVAAPASSQAPWKIQFTARGRTGKMSKDVEARYDTQKARAGVVIQGLYDAIFLEPSQLDDFVKRTFTEDAARSIDTRNLGLPPAATEVTTTTRTAQVGLDVETADVAVARVRVVATAGLEDRDVKVEHESTLWLERNDNTWRVIAFDLTQGPKK